MELDCNQEQTILPIANSNSNSVEQVGKSSRFLVAQRCVVEQTVAWFQRVSR